MSLEIKTTNHPVIVNGAKESPDSDYLSAEGNEMTVKTRYPLIVNNNVVHGNDVRSAADGVSAPKADAIRMRISKNNWKISNWQKQLDDIAQRVGNSSKPISKIDAAEMKGLNAQIVAAKKRNELLSAEIVRYSGANGDTDDFYGAEGNDFYGVDGMPLAGKDFDNINPVMPDGLTAPDSSSVLPPISAAIPAAIPATPVAPAVPAAIAAPASVAPLQLATPAPTTAVAPIATPITATAVPRHPYLQQRIARLNSVIENLQAKINGINTRVQMSGKPMGAVDANALKGYTKWLETSKNRLQRLMAMAPTSSADGSDDDFFSVDGEHFSYIDKNSPTDIKAFQDWLDAKGVKWVKASNAARNNGSLLNKGGGYGVYGPSTANAYAVYGAEWEAKKSGGGDIKVVTNGVPKIAAGGSPTVSQIQEQKKKGIIWNKAKGVWVTAKDLGIVDALLNTFVKKSDTSAIENQGLPATESKGGGKLVKTVLVIGGVALGAYIVYKLVKKSK